MTRLIGWLFLTVSLPFLHARKLWSERSNDAWSGTGASADPGDAVVLQECLDQYRRRGFDLERTFDAFAGYLKQAHVPFDFESKMSEGTFLLNQNKITYIENKDMVHGGVVDNVVKLFNTTKRHLGIQTLPRVAFHVNTEDSGIPGVKGPSTELSEKFCLHEADVNYVACSGTIALPIHGNQDLDLLAMYLNESRTLTPTSWDEKKNQAIWRGGNNQHRGERSRLLQIARSSNGLLDASFRYLSWNEFVSYKVIVAVDGFGPFSGVFKRALLSGSPIVQVGHFAGYGEWYEPMLQPYVHYVPARFDMGDLIEKIKWLLHDPTAAITIANNAATAAKFLFERNSVACYTYAALSYWSNIQHIKLTSVVSPFHADSEVKTVFL